MELIRDDPIIAHIMRTGYPPWVFDPVHNSDDEDDYWEGEYGDVYYGSETVSF